MARPPVQAEPAYEAVTDGVVVRVRPIYVPERSNPARSEFLFAYTVELENRRSDTVQLLGRHWIITDGAGRVEEVQGEGVVGEQPSLAPGVGFQYTSLCPLRTPSGEMRGVYQMTTAAGDRFEIAIPAFSLHLPQAGGRAN